MQIPVTYHARTMAHRSSPDDVALPVIPEWVEQVRRRIDEINQLRVLAGEAELSDSYWARRSGVDKGTFSKIVREGRPQASSKIVRRLSRALRIPEPVSVLATPEMQEWLDAFQQLDPERRVAILRAAMASPEIDDDD